MSASDIRARILAAVDLADELEEVPEWDVTLRLVTPTGEERATLASAFRGVDDADEEQQLALMFPALIAMCAHDPESGDRIFTGEDVAALARKNGAVVWRVGQKCQRLAGMTDDAVDQGKDASTS